jgi:polyferredoxin
MVVLSAIGAIKKPGIIIPFIIGITIALTLYFTIKWWGFLVIFPWIGLSISLGNFINEQLPNNRKGLGRRISLVMILPALLLFVPIVNNENFQLEGVLLLVLIGYFSKGFIHYAVAKLFGPLIWGRGFCGWACWTAAVLEWLPVREKGQIPVGLKNMRYITLGISILLPLFLVFIVSYNVRTDYLSRWEMVWMFVGNGIYYLLAIPLAFIFKDRRAFCKIACPVGLIMKIPTRFSLIKTRPSGKRCLECGRCNQNCPMDVDVMSYIKQGRKVMDTECINCGECKNACPAGAIR